MPRVCKYEILLIKIFGGYKMSNVSSITISCSECGKNIIMTAKDAKIRWKFNGGCPCNIVEVECPHCKKLSIVKPTPEAKKLLAHKIKAI